MKIGLFMYRLSFGGGEKVQLFLAKSFESLGHEIHIFSSDKQVQTLPYHIHISMFSGHLNIPRKIQYANWMSREIRESKLDVFIVFYNQDFVLLANLLSHTPIISSLRTDYYFNAKSFGRRIAQWCWLVFSKGVVFQTQAVRNCAPKIVQLKSIVIPNPVMIDNAEALINGHRKKKIVAVGRLSEEKGCLQLINAFCKTAGKHDYTLHFYGTGPLEDILKQYVDSLHMGNRIRIEGYIKSPEFIFSDSEIFVLNSKPDGCEGMPNSLIEAMSLECGCIATRINSGATEELIEDKINGLLVDFDNIEQLSNAIMTLIANENLRHDIQKAAGKLRKKLDRKDIILRWNNYILGRIYE